MRVFIDQAQKGIPLTQDQMIRAMTKIMEGSEHQDDVYHFLEALHKKGETAEEIIGAAKVMREKSIPIKAPFGTLDCCGTGGDGQSTYNISTAVALTAAACGVPIAKHGNRASTSKSGAADVLEFMGVNLDAPIEIVEHALETLGFTFLMAPNHHPAMKNVATVRKQITHRTIFNLIGPLANPAGSKHQLIGVYDKSLLIPFAEVLKELGTKGAWIVHGSDGLDEITTTGETYVVKLCEDGNITEETLTPESFGLPVSNPKDLTGGDAEENAKALRAVLEGEISAYRDIVLANTAAVLCIHGAASSLEEGVAKAAEALDTGEANKVLKDYIALSRRPAEDIFAA